MTHPTEVPESLEVIRAALAAGPTPGPWKLGPLFDNDGTPERIIGALEDSAVIAVALEFGKNNPGFRDANAALIAACNPTAITALLDALKARDSEIERLRGALRQAQSEMRPLIENSLCAADPDRSFGDVLAEVKAHPAIKAIDEALARPQHA